MKRTNEFAALTRRDALGATVALAAAVGATSLAQPVSTPQTTNKDGNVGTHAVRPLPFNPAKLRGLSEKLLTSHHENNYAGAVKNLNKVELELAQLSKDAPGFLVGGLK